MRFVTEKHFFSLVASLFMLLIVIISAIISPSSQLSKDAILYCSVAAFFFSVGAPYILPILKNRATSFPTIISILSFCISGKFIYLATKLPSFSPGLKGFWEQVLGMSILMTIIFLTSAFILSPVLRSLFIRKTSYPSMDNMDME